MITFYNNKSLLRSVPEELHRGRLVDSVENPSRVERILERLQATGLSEVRGPTAHGDGPLKSIHCEDYLDFLRQAWTDWIEYIGDPSHTLAIPSVWPSRTTSGRNAPAGIVGKLGYYSFATDTAIDRGTWDAACASADAAVSAVEFALKENDAAFALCRPPGHHATASQYGGYCFFNNAAIAAQVAIDSGIDRVAILDVDYHHGNGTQEIFYGRSDVLFISIHCDPAAEFPFYTGLASEHGNGDGAGFNINYPLPPGTDYQVWSYQLDKALGEIQRYGAKLLVVSLGVDTFEGDPLGTFRLESADFEDYGRKLARIGIPTVFVMEGGYAVAEIGINVVGVLGGFSSGT